MSRRLDFAVSVVLALAWTASASGEPAGRARATKTWTWNFAADTLGQAPPNTATFGGNWEVVIDSSRAPAQPSAPSGAPVSATDSTGSATDSTASATESAGALDALAAAPRVLRQSEADDGIQFHYIQFKKPTLEGQAISVRFRILAGDIDPTAGVMFQVDSKGRNGYIVRVSGGTNQLVVHYLIYGKRRDIRYAKIPPVQLGTWHTLSVERKGSVMVVTYDGEERVRIRDERYMAGSVGLWTEDDTVVDFEQLAVSKR